MLKKYPALFATILALLVLYKVLFWYANHYPGTIAKAYFEAIGNRDYNRAWGLLTPEYREDRWESKESFQRAYATSAHHERFQVIAKETSFRIYPTLMAKSLSFEAEYEVTERFTREDIDSPEQHINTLWLQIRHPENFIELTNDNLTHTRSLTLTRCFKTLVVLQRPQDEKNGTFSMWIIPSKWLIQRMNFSEQCLILN